MRHFLLILLAVVIFGPVMGQKPKQLEKSVHIVPDKYVVKLNDGGKLKTGVEDYESRIGKLQKKVNDFSLVSYERAFPNAKAGRSVRSNNDYASYYFITTSGGSTQTVLSEIGAMADVEYVEPEYMYEPSYTPNDPDTDSQEYLDVIQAYEAWDVSQGSQEVVVAVVDDGVDYLHEDLAAALYVNEDEIPDNGIDDDGDGFIDNVNGWDFMGQDFENIIPDNEPRPGSGASSLTHGTRVAGCAAARADNGVGIAGVGFNVSYMALKCSAENDTRSNGRAFIINSNQAVVYAADNGADVINMSYGGSGFSQFTQDVMTYAAIENDVVLVSSAGNGGTDTPQYPSAYDHVISVAATNFDDTKASFSEHGDWVDITAPGVSIYTTLPNDNYNTTQGTSFSSPIVAGAAALLRSYFPDYNQFQIAETLIQTADDISAAEPDFVIGGRLNMHAALTETVSGFRIDGFEVLNASGDIPSTGETALISLNVINELSPSSSQTNISIVELSSLGVEFSSTSESIGAVATDQTIVLDDLFTFSVPDGIPFNSLLDMELFIEDDESGYSENYYFQAVLNPIKTNASTTPYLVTNGGDFEDDNGGFASGQIAGGTDVWEWGEPTNELTETASGTRVWKTDLDGNLPKETYSCVLQTPKFDFSDDETEYLLSFYKSMESEFCNAPSAVQLQYTTDGGITWNRLGEKDNVRGTNWYNKDLNSACQIDISLLPDQIGWLGNFSNEYTAYNISDLGGNEEVIFRFLLSVSGGFSSDLNDDGFMVDDFQIEKVSPRANFFTEETVTYVGRSVSFEFLSSGATSYTWDFGDGTNSSDQNPIHVYSEAGVYDISLEIQTAGGLTKDTTFQEYVAILPQLDVPFTAADGGNFEGNLESFAALNIAGTGFERGNSSVTGKDGTTSGDFAWVTGLEEEQYQDDTEAYLYTPEFDLSESMVYELNFSAKYAFESQWDGFVVEYTTNSGLSWIKLNDVVEDGWYDDVSVENAIWGTDVPIFTGTTNGEFVTKSTDLTFLGGESTVSFRFLFLTDANTTDVGGAIDDFLILSTEAVPAAPNFTASAEGGCVNETITFSDNSTGDVLSYSWDFGTNATPQTATGPGPHSVSYSETGSYTVNLTVEGVGNGTQIEEKVDFIEISPSHEPFFTRVNNNDGTYTLTASDGDSYQWFRDGEALEGETGNTLIVSLGDGGRFYAVVTIGTCGVQTSSEIVNSIIEEGDISIYPNPVSSVLKVNSVVPLVGSYSITTVTGQVIDSKVMNGSELQIDLSDKAEGIYFLHLNTEDEKRVVRFIIAR